MHKELHFSMSEMDVEAKKTRSSGSGSKDNRRSSSSKEQSSEEKPKDAKPSTKVCYYFASCWNETTFEFRLLKGDKQIDMTKSKFWHDRKSEGEDDLMLQPKLALTPYTLLDKKT